MPKNKKWWERKWYWALCAILPLLVAPSVPYLMEGADLTGSIIMAVPISAGVLFAYFVRSTGSLHLYRILAIGGGASLGFIVGLLSIDVLNLNLIIPRPFIWPMLLGTTILGAIIADIVMKRRGYRPFM